MSNIIKSPTRRMLLRNQARSGLAAMANYTPIQHTELSLALARLVELMDKNNRSKKHD